MGVLTIRTVSVQNLFTLLRLGLNIKINWSLILEGADFQPPSVQWRCAHAGS